MTCCGKKHSWIVVEHILDRIIAVCDDAIIYDGNCKEELAFEICKKALNSKMNAALISHSFFKRVIEPINNESYKLPMAWVCSQIQDIDSNARRR